MSTFSWRAVVQVSKTHLLVLSLLIGFGMILLLVVFSRFWSWQNRLFVKQSCQKQVSAGEAFDNSPWWQRMKTEVLGGLQARDIFAGLAKVDIFGQAHFSFGFRWLVFDHFLCLLLGRAISWKFFWTDAADSLWVILFGLLSLSLVGIGFLSEQNLR